MKRTLSICVWIGAGAVALAVPAATWKPFLAMGKTVNYRLVVTQVEYEGSTTKVTSKLVTETPVKVTRNSVGSVEVVTGPLFTRGRSVGRARVNAAPYNGRDSFAPLAPVIPQSGLKIGASWKGPLSALAPVPAGIQGTYKLLSFSQSSNTAVVAVSALQEGGARLKVSGKLILDGQSGTPKGGKIRFETEYLRPDLKDRAKMVVNSHQTIDYVVKAK